MAISLGLYIPGTKGAGETVLKTVGRASDEMEPQKLSTSEVSQSHDHSILVPGNVPQQRDNKTTQNTEYKGCQAA